MTLFDQLWITAENAIGQSGYEITPECEQDLRALIQQGVINLNSDPQGSSAEALEGAKQKVELLVSAMVKEEKANRTAAVSLVAAKHVLHEWSLSGARLKVCPLYPFC